MTTILLDGFRSLLFIQQFLAQNFGDSTPSPTKGCEITDKTLLAPCKILFSFLLQAYKYAKLQYLSKVSSTKAMTKVYLHTCCMSGDVSDNVFSMENNVKHIDAPETIVTTPVLWLQHVGQDDSILSAKLIRIAPENSSF
jgi:hypothetical protein